MKEIKASGLQAEEMLAHAGTQAQASLTQVGISEMSMIASNRAYVHHNGFRYISHLNTTTNKYFWRVRPLWINSGNTPTRQLRVHVRYELRNDPLPEGFQFPLDDGTVPTLLSPKQVIESDVFDISGDDLVAVKEHKKHFYVWGVAKYRDVFPATTEHMTRFCCHAGNVTGEPLLGWDANTNPVEIRFYMFGWHNCADEECGTNQPGRPN